MHEENKALKDLAKLPLKDKMARQVAKKELAMERYKKKIFTDESEKNSIKRFKKRNVQSDSKESDDSEHERQVKKERKLQVKKKEKRNVRKRVKVAIVIPAVKAAPIVTKSR